jgi:hypothetical protein
MFVFVDQGSYDDRSGEVYSVPDILTAPFCELIDEVLGDAVIGIAQTAMTGQRLLDYWDVGEFWALGRPLEYWRISHITIECAQLIVDIAERRLPINPVGVEADRMRQIRANIDAVIDGKWPGIRVIGRVA